MPMHGVFSIELHPIFQKCKIVPVMFGNPTPKNCRIFAGTITAAAGDKKVFVLSSTDMSRYPSYDDARKVDGATLEMMKSIDVDKLFSHLSGQIAYIFTCASKAFVEILR